MGIFYMCDLAFSGAFSTFIALRSCSPMQGSVAGEPDISSAVNSFFFDGVWQKAEPVTFMLDCPVYYSNVFLSSELKFFLLLWSADVEDLSC